MAADPASPPPACHRAVHLGFGAAAAIALALLGMLIWWTGTPEARYAVMPCQYDAIYGHATPVRAIVLGTSRAQHGIDPGVLARELAVDGEPAAVINVARGNRGPEQLYQMLLDADRARTVRGPIVFEYSPLPTAFWQDAPLYYQAYPGFAANADFAALTANWDAKPREPAYGRLRDLLGFAEYRVDAAIEALLTGKASQRRTLPEWVDAPRSTTWCLLADSARQTPGERRQLRRVARQAAARYGADATARDIAPAPDALDDINQDAQAHYLRLMIAFARTRHVPIVAVEMPGYLEPAQSDAARARFARRFGIPLLYPPAAVVQALNASNGYQDAFHLNAAGARTYSTWLASVIRRQQPPR
ncbi:MAG: hypothetical protein ACR2JV_01740 [Gaiellales bacterium]